jgi:hypothetical protein
MNFIGFRFKTATDVNPTNGVQPPPSPPVNLHRRSLTGRESLTADTPRLLSLNLNLNSSLKPNTNTEYQVILPRDVSVSHKLFLPLKLLVAPSSTNVADWN